MEANRYCSWFLKSTPSYRKKKKEVIAPKGYSILKKQQTVAW